MSRPVSSKVGCECEVEVDAIFTATSALKEPQGASSRRLLLPWVEIKAKSQRSETNKVCGPEGYRRAPGSHTGH